MKVFLEINNCSKCPNFDSSRYYTSDSFENVVEWKCLKMNKRIALVDTFDKDPKIPEWCPLI